MDNVKQYTSELERLKNLAVNQFQDLSQVEKDTIDQAFEWLVSNLDVKAGQFVVTPELTDLMNRFVVAVVDSLHTNEDYQSMLNEYLTNIETIGKNLIDFHSSINNLDLAAAGITPVQTAVVNELIDSYTENGLNQGFASPLRDIIYRNILAGMNLKEAKTYLTDYIASGKDETGKLGQYLTQTAQTGVDAYTGAINTKIYQTFTFTGFIMSGSLIETSSRQCVLGIEEGLATGGYLTNTQIDVLLAVARLNNRAPLIPGTTKENLDINKLHWGCRHEFTPFIKN
jgi:hypothetical protein